MQEAMLSSRPLLMQDEEIFDWSNWIRIAMKMKARPVQMFAFEQSKIEESDGEEKSGMKYSDDLNRPVLIN